MNDLFVPYRIALIAKKKGFIELCYMAYNPCVRVWFQQGTGLISEGNLTDKQVLAPMYQQLINWFREKHEIEIYAIKQIEENEYGGIVGWCGVEEYSTKSCAPTYNEALDKALIEAFKLIK